MEARQWFNFQRRLWYSPEDNARKLDGFPTNTLEGGLKSVKAKGGAKHGDDS